jgi:hypothetical protein
MGFPPIETSGFPGSRVDANRAGITTTTFGSSELISFSFAMASPRRC